MLRGQKRTPADFVRIVSELHPELDFSITEYKNARSPVKFRCKEHGEQEIQANGLLHGRGCPKCGRRRSAEAGLVPWAKAHVMTDAEKQAAAERLAAGRAARTPDDFKRAGEKISQAQKARYAGMTEEERRQRMANAKQKTRERWAALTPEERKQHMNAVRAAKQKHQ
ncbi:MAG: hypothetical protein U1F63_02135 [Chitinivorax sp.]